MKPKQFVKEVKFLFSNNFLDTVYNERPEEVASCKANTKFRCLLKTLFPDCKIDVSKGSFCESWGRVIKDNHQVTIIVGDYRWPICGRTWEHDITVRTSDPTGKTRDGRNINLYNIDLLQNTVEQLLKQEHHPMF